MSDERLTRRECLTRGAGAVVAAGVAAAGGYLLYDPKGDAGLGKAAPVTAQLKNFFADVDFPPSNPRISIATGDDQRGEKLTRAAVAGLDPTHGMKRFVKPDDVVLIKPNVGFDRPPHLGATTNPDVLRAVIRLCREAGARQVLITDNPIESPSECFTRTGIRQVAEEEGAEVVMPTPSRFETLTFRAHRPNPNKGEVLGRWPILYEPLARATKLIGVAPVKDHNLASASMALKNWYGLLGSRRNQFHQAIHEIISDLALMISPTLVIADATRVMMRNGPTGGRMTDVQPGGKLGRPAVIAAVDPVACDAWCYENLLGRDPTRLTYLDLARDKIRAAVAAGQSRFGESDWRAYDRQGRIATASL
jgi:uncharacterized protein (DUF362 family)